LPFIGSSGPAPRCFAQPNVGYWTQCDGAATLLEGVRRDYDPIIFVVACAIGVEHLRSAHPDIPVYCAAIHPELNGFGYIVARLGDAGDRYFGPLW
jgi:hypothetical protein